MKISEIDNIAYKLYTSHANSRLTKKNKKLSMEYIKIELFVEYKKIFNSFYQEANIILRKEKINNLNEKLL